MAESVEAIPERTGLSASAASLGGLLKALQRLERLLERAIAAAQAAYGSEAASDPHRGLYISQDEIERLLVRQPGAPTLQMNGIDLKEAWPDPLKDSAQMAAIAQKFGLSSFDLDLLLIAIAPELDLRYERLYAYLQDDVTRRRPSVDLALNLLCSDATEKLSWRSHFASDAPLIRHGLLYLLPDPNHLQPPLLAHYLKLDEQVVRLLLGQTNLDPRLIPFCQLVQPTVQPSELPLSNDIKHALAALTSQAQKAYQPLKLYFHGPHGVGKRRTAEAIAGKINAPLLVVDLIRALAVNSDFEQMLKLLFREAWSFDAILYLDNLDALGNDEHSIRYQQLMTTVAQDTGMIIMAGLQPWIPLGRGLLGPISVPFAIPDFTQRRASWQANLSASGITLNAQELDTLSDRFRLLPNQIAEAVVTARNHAQWRNAAQSPDKLPSQSSIQPTINDLFTTARAQSGQNLQMLARKIEPKYTWNDIVLPPDQLAQLKEACNQVKYQHIVYENWGFERKLSLGKGVNMLFSGSPGTGKTMAAEVIANDLQLDLYKIDLSQVVSKYIGETEKNLDRIFTLARNANAILFFDEADALFGKRSEVKDAHDRYANIEIAYLLQKMEEHEGITILATNLHQNLDEAFTRRVRFILEFPFPEQEYRLSIWQTMWPKETPLAPDVDLNFMAQQFKLAGGNIRNIAVAAAFLAAENGQSVGMKHLLQATKREFQKMGRLVSNEEFLKFDTSQD